nr:hypothetical protein [Natronoglycomyces albus]
MTLLGIWCRKPQQLFTFVLQQVPLIRRKVVKKFEPDGCRRILAIDKPHARQHSITQEHPWKLAIRGRQAFPSPLVHNPISPGMRQDKIVKRSNDFDKGNLHVLRWHRSVWNIKQLLADRIGVCDQLGAQALEMLSLFGQSTPFLIVQHRGRAERAQIPPYRALRIGYSLCLHPQPLRSVRIGERATLSPHAARRSLHQRKHVA